MGKFVYNTRQGEVKTDVYNYPKVEPVATLNKYSHALLK
ncbi:hypothetical protein PP101_35 [Pectobacterium phage PP101]|uniref:Uncharacterized protein n=1 Tax=Pectobacterium phage PP101 TaxID=1916414 RepID=A0A1J0MEV2_9CAUD|nr:hypothetical protein HOR42_gp35 [Pectobacterium phage PP101]APD19695.1 hypothetical protein PP101_35 [Pectobacterium phage PP101]